MIFDYILYGIALIGLVAGSYSDLKTREVPDWLSYGMIFTGLGLRLVFSLKEFNWSIFFEGLIGFLVFVVIAYMMYYMGQWGGGDSKLLMGLGALIGLKLQFNPLPNLGLFFLNLLIIGAVYGLIWLVMLAVLNKSKFLDELKKQNQGLKNIKLGLLFLGIAAVVGSFLVPGLLKGLFLAIGIMPLGTMYAWMGIKSVENFAFYKQVNPKQLTEGDWIAEDVVVGGKKICGPRDLGIDQEHIAQLIKLHSQGKVKKIKIKEGIPFVPSFLVAFLLTIIVGNWLAFLF
ncbi:prepilin peptidase [Nanoarchaeota archaeon]